MWLLNGFFSDKVIDEMRTCGRNRQGQHPPTPRLLLLLLPMVLLTSAIERHRVDGQRTTSADRRDAAVSCSQLQQQLNDITGQLAVVTASLEQIRQDNDELKDNLRKAVNAFGECRSSENPFAAFARPRDCEDIRTSGLNSSGVYALYTGRMQRPLLAYCDMTTDGGGWTVFQRRQDGSENFYRNWFDYANGFGNLHAEFWLGNENIYALLNDGRQYKLRFDLADFNGTTRYAEYDNFKLGSSWDKYKAVSVGGYSGTAGDSYSGVAGQKFSTHDQDNDVYGESCAVAFKGAWWYSNCHASNLNGHYYGGAHSSYADGIEWYSWTGYYYSLKFTEMKIRPV